MSKVQLENFKYHLSSDGLLSIEITNGEKNLISRELVDEFGASLAPLFSNLDVKVVLIYGNGQYFCSGADETVLEEIASKMSSFSDYKLFEFLLNCPVPVIVAMNGHAIGGGLSLACYADFMLFSEESRYMANFVQHGFTPGVGSTFIYPERFGTHLGFEMLYTAKLFSGAELKIRHPALIVIKKNHILNEAISFADQLLKQPSYLLRAHKKLLSHRFREALPEVFQREREAHTECFSSNYFLKDLL